MKWKVDRNPPMFWRATPYGDMGPTAREVPAYPRWFLTWREAYDHAYRMARPYACELRKEEA